MKTDEEGSRLLPCSNLKLVLANMGYIEDLLRRLLLGKLSDVLFGLAPD